MQFTAGTLLIAGAAFLTAASAQNIFAIQGTGIIGNSVSLHVANGNAGGPNTCDGSVTIDKLPATGSIQCKDGYSLTFKWDSVDQGHFSAEYTTPNSPPFTYNLPINEVHGNTYLVGFSNSFPAKRAEKPFRA